MKRSLRICAVLCAATAVASGLAPALASARSPWQVVYRHRFAAHSFSGFSVIAPGGRGEMWAAGGYGVAGNGLAGAVLWRNHRWHVTPVPDPGTLGAITGLSADSASDAWAVTANGYVLRWDGRQWRIAKRLAEPQGGPPGDEPTGVLAINARNVWVFYATWRDSHNHVHGGALHDLNGTWREATGPGRTIIAASEATPADLWAIGGTGSHVGLLHHEQRGWKPVTAQALTGLTFASILALRRGPVWALGWPSAGTGPAELVELSSGRWTGHPLPAAIKQANFLLGATELASDGHAGIWVAAPAFYPHSGHLLHLARGRWQQIALGANVNAHSVVAVPRSHTLCAAGSADNYNATSATALVWSTASAC